MVSGFEVWGKRPERVQRTWVWESTEQGWTLALPSIAARVWASHSAFLGLNFLLCTMQGPSHKIPEGHEYFVTVLVSDFSSSGILCFQK